MEICQRNNEYQYMNIIVYEKRSQMNFRSVRYLEVLSTLIYFIST